jgi:hypothetical protein
MGSLSPEISCPSKAFNATYKKKKLVAILKPKYFQK